MIQLEGLVYGIRHFGPPVRDSWVDVVIGGITVLKFVKRMPTHSADIRPGLTPIFRIDTHTR